MGPSGDAPSFSTNGGLSRALWCDEQKAVLEGRVNEWIALVPEVITKFTVQKNK